MTDIRETPFIVENGLTIQKLKEILSILPDKNEYGEDFEVRIGTNDNSSISIKYVLSLDIRDTGCDILLQGDFQNY